MNEGVANLVQVMTWSVQLCRLPLHGEQI